MVMNVTKISQKMKNSLFEYINKHSKVNKKALL